MADSKMIEIVVSALVTMALAKIFNDMRDMEEKAKVLQNRINKLEVESLNEKKVRQLFADKLDPLVDKVDSIIHNQNKLFKGLGEVEIKTAVIQAQNKRD